VALIAMAAALLLAGAGATAPGAGAEATAEQMYQPSTVDVVKLSLPQASVEKLEAEPKKYVKGTFSLAETEGAPGTERAFSPPLEVGIKLKGSIGSLRELDEKAAFNIKFGKYVDDQTFLGLDKMSLNNMVQDPSMLDETLGYELFRANRVPGSHTGFAYLYVNLAGEEENFGVHLNIEAMDKAALERRFGDFHEPPQHLYEGNYGADVDTEDNPSTGQERWEGFEVDEGEEADWSDLTALVDAVTAPGPVDFSERVAPYADLQEMVHQWAVEKYISHWDGYAGRPGDLQPNNYYLYSSDSGVFSMLPWGIDQTWGRTDQVASVEKLEFDGQDGVLFNECLEDSSCETMYRRALRELLASLGPLGLESLADRTSSLLEPWQALEEAPRQPYDADEIEAAVKGAEEYIAERPAELRTFLAEGPPEATATAIEAAVDPGTVDADGSAEAIVTAQVSSAEGAPVFGDQVTFSADDPGVHFGPVVDEGEGAYTTTLTSSTTPGSVTITATDAMAEISATTTLTQVDGDSGPTTPAQPSGGGSAGPPAPTGGGSSVAPVARLTRAPGHRTRARRPTFRFTADRAGAAFECRIGSGRFRACRSPYRVRRLGAGRHSFSVRAYDGAGVGPVAKYRFVVSAHRHHRRQRTAHRHGDGSPVR
jgi:hypothetical protein